MRNLDIFHLILIFYSDLLYLELVMLLCGLNSRIQPVYLVLKLGYGLVQMGYLQIEITLSMFPSNLFPHMRLDRVLQLQLCILLQVLLLQVYVAKLSYVFLILLLQAAEISIVRPLLLMLQFLIMKSDLFNGICFVLSPLLFGLLVQLVSLFNTSFQICHLFDVPLLHILESMTDFMVAAAFNLHLLQSQSLIILFPHVINHTHPSFIVILDLVLQFFDSLRVNLLLPLQLDIDFGFFLCMVLFKFSQFKCTVVEFHLKLLKLLYWLNSLIFLIVVAG